MTACLLMLPAQAQQSGNIFPREDLFQNANAAYNSLDYANASRVYALACEAGHYAACYNLAGMHDDGKAPSASKATARALFKKICDAGFSRGCFSYGAYLDQGTGGPQDLAAAYQAYSAAAAKGHAKGAYNAGHMALMGAGMEPDIKVATRFFEMAANRGDENAMTAMGAIYEGGFGHYVDMAKAFEWYKSASAKGNTFASTRVTLMGQVAYERAMEAEKNLDYAEAGKALKFSCEKGYRYACYKYGEYQYYGRGGVAKDPYSAVSTFNDFCKTDPDFGCPAVMKVVGEKTSLGLDEVKPLKSWLETGCNKGNGARCYNLSVLYSEGRFMMQDRDTRLRYLKEACDKNYQAGCNAYRQLNAPNIFDQAVQSKPPAWSNYTPSYVGSSTYRSPTFSSSYDNRQAARDFAQRLSYIRSIGSARTTVCPASNRYC